MKKIYLRLLKFVLLFALDRARRAVERVLER